MNFLSIPFPIFMVCVSVAADVIKWDATLPWDKPSDAAYWYTEGVCVNFDPKWTAKGKSIDTYDKCVTLYSKKDCRGESANFRSVSTYHFLQFLDRINFEGRAASFNKCNGSNHQTFEFGQRPLYHFILHAEEYENSESSEAFSLRSGECRTLPGQWLSNIPYVTRYVLAVSLFSEIDCEGTEIIKDVMTTLPSDDRRKTGVVKSLRLTDLEFRAPCLLCPKFLYPDSREYKFWSYLFSVYSGAHQELFAERVNRSIDGFISWDFLFAPTGNTSAPAISTTNRYYADACLRLVHLFSFLRVSRVGQLGFAINDITVLHSLAKDVHAERKSQIANRTLVKMLSRPNNKLLGIIERDIWRITVVELQNIESAWRTEIALINDENKYVGRPTFSISISVPEQSANFILKTGECVPVPAAWHNRVQKIDANGHCFVLFENVDCDGPKHWAIAFNNIRQRDLILRKKLSRNDKATKSVRVCNLNFRDSCTQCPKLLYTGSVEFDFWMFFLGIRSRPNRREFQERVTRSTNGFISWNFLSASNPTNQSADDQYRFAIDSLFETLRSVQADHPGKWGFNTRDVEFLRALAAHVLAERQKQAEEVNNEGWDGGDIATMEQLISIWLSVQNILSQTLASWDPDTITDSICGLVNEPMRPKGAVPQVYRGKDAVYGDDPWHAAIYRRGSKVPTLICGATLISSRILVSAAHCFYDENTRKALNKTIMYEIVLGKFTRDHRIRDSVYQNYYKIKELVFHTNGFDPILTDNYGSDIILIILETPVEFNSHVRPACLDWDNLVFGSSTYDNTTGRLVGWGVTINQPAADDSDFGQHLMTADLPYISFEKCKGKLTSITNDKFCAGSEKGAGPRSGDSGGGLVFKHKYRYYLRGLVSTRDTESESSITAFTDLAFYLKWIQKYV